MSRLGDTFATAARAGRLVLAPFVMIGYPDPPTSIELAESYLDAGAGMLELGVPFSDPIADGPTIQRASQRALDQGVTVETGLRMIETIRRRSTDAPLLMMGYANPFMRRGFDRLAEELAAVGGDGLIVPDLPVEVGDEVAAVCRGAGLDLIYFVAPTTPPERMAAIGAKAAGFLYCVSLTGVTGRRDRLRNGLPDFLARVRAATQVPRVVGFGISKPEHVAALLGTAEGAIVASALIDAIDASEPSEAVARAADHVKRLVEAARCDSSAT